MSRIGLKPVEVPAGVEVTITEDNQVKVKGAQGELEERLSNLLTIEKEGDTIKVSRSSDAKASREQHGLARTLIANMIQGVSQGFSKELELQGVGYKAAKQGKKLVLNIGYSNPVELEDPQGITTEVPEATKVVVKGIDKAAVGNYAANIRKHRPPEPYKGKGIRYVGEYVRRKEGKAGVKGGE